VPEIRESGIREIFVQSDRLIYGLNDVEVRIIAFIHGARDFATWQCEQRPEQ
jgi:hypothetical protein